MSSLYPKCLKDLQANSLFIFVSEIYSVPTTKNAQPNYTFNLLKKIFLPFLLWEMHSSSFTVAESDLVHFYPFLYNLTYYW